MTEGKQKVHPMAVPDMEAPPPTTPLVAGGSVSSEKGSPTREQYQTFHSVPPAMQSGYGRGSRSCCCKCICWTIALIVLLLVAVAATAGIIYLLFRPKLPSYSVDKLSISDLRLNYDLSLYAKFDVKITAKNPNKKIGIYYEKGGIMSVLMTAIQQQQQTGKIPLNLKIRAPVAIKLGSLKLRKVKISGDCDLTVDSMSANSAITIKASNCKFGFKL